MADTPRRAVMVPAGDAVIETIAEGTGPALVMLPSLGRDGYEDFDEVAGMLAAGGLIPSARNAGRVSISGAWYQCPSGKSGFEAE